MVRSKLEIKDRVALDFFYILRLKEDSTYFHVQCRFVPFGTFQKSMLFADRNTDTEKLNGMFDESFFSLNAPEE